MSRLPPCSLLRTIDRASCENNYCCLYVVGCCCYGHRDIKQRPGAGQHSKKQLHGLLIYYGYYHANANRSSDNSLECPSSGTGPV